MHNLISGGAAGLDQLIRTRGRAHGNLSPATILISGPRRLSRAGVALADPPGIAPASEADDLYALGLLIFRLVTHKQFDKIFNYPIDPKLFTGLRRHVDAWCSLCGRLLDPDASQRLTKLSDLVAALEEMKPRLPRPPRWLIIALVMGLAGYFIGQALVGWRDRSALASLKNDPWFGEFARLVAQEGTRQNWERDPTLKLIIGKCEDVGLLSGGAKRPPWESDKEGGKKQTGPWFESISLSWSGKWKGHSIRREVNMAREALTKAKSDLSPKTWTPVTSSDPRLSRLVAATIKPTPDGIVQPAQITTVLDLKSKIPDLEQELKSFDTALVGELRTLKDRVDFGDDENTFRNNLSNARTSIPETVPGDSGIVTAIIKSKHPADRLIASATLVKNLTDVCNDMVKWRKGINEKRMAFENAAKSLGITVTVPAPATQPAEGFGEACRALADELSKATESMEAAQKAFNSVRAGTIIPERPGIDPDGKLKSDMKPSELAAAVQGLRDRLATSSKKRTEINDQIAKVLLARPGDSDLAGLSGFMADELLGANDLGSLEKKLSTVGTAIGDIHSYVVGDRKLEVDWVVFAERKLATTQPATSPSDRYQRWTTLADECRKLKPDEKTRFDNMLAGWPGNRFSQVDASIENAKTSKVAAEKIDELAKRNTNLRLSFNQIKGKSPCQLALRERPGELKTLDANIKQLADSINVAIAGGTVAARIAILDKIEFKALKIKPEWEPYVKRLSSQDEASIKTAEEAGKNLTDLETWASEDAATNGWPKEFQTLANTARSEAAKSLVPAPADWTKLADWTNRFEQKFVSAKSAYKEWHKKLTPLSDGWSLICQRLSGQYLPADEQKKVTDMAQNIAKDDEVKLGLSGNPIWPQVELLLQTVADKTDRKTLSEIYRQPAAKLAVKLAVLRRLDALSEDSFQNSEEFDLAGQLLKELVGKAKEDVLREVKGFWTKRAPNIHTLKDLESAIASKKSFLLDDDPWPLKDKDVSADLRHDLLLKQVSDENLKQASDEKLKQVVGDLMKKLIENGNEPPDDSALSKLKGELKTALNNDGPATRPATAPSSQPTDAGPASEKAKVKWTLQKNEQDGVLEFTWSSPQNKKHTLFFRHVKTADGHGPGAYLCTTEMSVGLFADIYTASRALWPQVEKDEIQRVWSDGSSVLTWSLDKQTIREPLKKEGWMPRQDREKNDYYAPNLRDANGLLPPGGPPEREHPIQYLTSKAAVRLADLLGCRLPTEKEWQAAEKKMPPGAKPNLRDSVWQIQHEYVPKLLQAEPPWLNAPDPSSGSYSSNPQAAGDIWDQNLNGKFVTGGPGLPYVDGSLWFDKVCPDPGKATDFYHLIGNVAEFVTNEPLALGEDGKPQNKEVRLLIIGASALSAPDPKDLTSGVERINGNPWAIRPEAFSDVGFRLAFSASAAPATSPLRTFIAKANYVLAK
ncbi:MAG: hypothetical protein NTU53_18860 [Planctomycetota bacterium]|nr:hypothetical protein [Planctomycetota bacterium]